MAPTTCGILVPQPGLELASLQWKHGILATGPMMLMILHNILRSCSFCYTRRRVSTQSLVITCMHHTACDRHVLSHSLFLFLATSCSPTKTLFSWHFLQEGPRLGDVFISYRHNFGAWLCHWTLPIVYQLSMYLCHPRRNHKLLEIQTLHVHPLEQRQFHGSIW